MSRKWKPKKQRPHAWFSVSPKTPWYFCARCRIIALRNEATAAVVNKPCKGLEEEDAE